jgi:hypothetical protein
MAKVSGFSFKKDNKGKVEGVAGKKILPHRIELIETAIKQKKPKNNIAEMFFNFQLKDCRNESSRKEIEIESSLFDEWSKGHFKHSV